MGFLPQIIMIYIVTVVNHYLGTVEIYPHYQEVDAYITASASAVRVLQNLGLSNPSNIYYHRYVTFLTYALSNVLSDLSYALSEYDSIINSFPSQDVTLITILNKQVSGTVPAGVCTTPNSFIPGIAPAVVPIKPWNFGGFIGFPNIQNTTEVTPIIPVSKSNCKNWGCGTELYTDEEYCWKCGRKNPTD